MVFVDHSNSVYSFIGTSCLKNQAEENIISALGLQNGGWWALVILSQTFREDQRPRSLPGEQDYSNITFHNPIQQKGALKPQLGKIALGNEIIPFSQISVLAQIPLPSKLFIKLKYFLSFRLSLTIPSLVTPAPMWWWNPAGSWSSTTSPVSALMMRRQQWSKMWTVALRMALSPAPLKVLLNSPKE